MRAQFARAIDPIFLAAHDLITRIEEGDRLVVGDERERLLRLFDRCELALGNTADWQLAKYALCAWIDSQLINAPWIGRDWWTDNSLERHLFGHGIAHAEFFVRAAESSRLPSKDALEVYYLAVVLGFRGFYDDANAAARAASLGLPPTLEEWCRKVSLSLQLRQDRQPFDDSSRKGEAARPLTGRTSLINVSLITVLLVALAIGFFWLRASRGSADAPQSRAPSPATRLPNLL
jgi:type VI secretion system protein ImpK